MCSTDVKCVFFRINLTSSDNYHPLLVPNFKEKLEHTYGRTSVYSGIESGYI